MGLFDVVVIGVAIVGYALGRARGLVWQVSGLLTLLLGGVAATILSGPVGALFHDGILGRFVGWIAVYAIVATALYVLTLSFREKLKELELTELDKRFGGVLGGIKALCVLAVITLVAVPLSPRVANGVKPTPSGRVLCKLVEELRELLPERIPDTFAGRTREPAPEPEASPPPLERRPTAPTKPRAEPARTVTPPRPATPSAPEFDGELPAPPRRVLPRDETGGEDHVDRDLTESDPFDTRNDPVDPLAPPR